MKRVVPFLKVDKGLATEMSGVHLMRPMPQLAALLDRAKAKRIFGTKMRSVINQANVAGIKDIVNQQFEAGRQIIAAGLVPIIEPEVDIHCSEKAKAEALLKAAIGSVTLPNIARNKSPDTSGSRRSDDFTPCLHGRCPEGSVRSC